MIGPMINTGALVEKIHASIIGGDRVINGPFGGRRLAYADYTASGRSLSFIEDFLRDRVMPYYANTHTETSLTGLQTTHYREQARETIRRSIGADDDYAVIFCGAGTTGAINRLIDILNIRIPSDLDARYELSRHIPAEQRPVVLIGPYEHHSNELPWRESIADVVAIEEDADGRIDLGHLERQLALYRDRELVIGSFSAASNVTGIVSDIHAITTLLHDHGALNFWDYGAAAPYIGIDATGDNSGGESRAAMDAMFMSPHKFPGGPGTPGILVVRKELLVNGTPARPGGGTVAYVNPVEHVYIDNLEHREEGGTPAIVESIRAGLVFQVKDSVGAAEIEARDEAFLHRAFAVWLKNPNLHILGNPDLKRLAIVSFVVRHGQQNLHHDFVVALLNDLFGIQSRGGCSCAGPYGHRLLDISLDQSRAFRDSIVEGCNGIKPGWVRLGFNYFFSDALTDYIIAAVDMVASHGWKLLPDYTFEPDSGIWRHRTMTDSAPYGLEDMDILGPGGPAAETATEDALDGYLQAARDIFADAGARQTQCCATEAMGDDAETLRWFPLPEDIDQASVG
jgi:selenocysteine lyase/cysteine desulfurase